MVTFWVTLLAISILLYVLLDGFDLGVGMLFGLTRNESERHAMIMAVAPIWDGNETWLVVTAVILWGAFPVAYSILLSAFYLPLLVMLAGLILRGVAFEYRYKTTGMRWLWNWSFAGGSFAASFIQGLGLCIGYALLGACWLVKKSEGELRERAYRLVPYLAVGLLVFLVVVFAYALAENLRVLGRWLERPYLFIFPVIGALCVAVLAFSVRYRRDDLPFPMVVVIFVAAFGTLAISFWPYIIPFVLTVYEAAAPESSLAFMFWGEGLFIFPLLLLYTAINYSVFRGKVSPTDGHY
jgi:cytochrome bd ubiquinol oxidase subunit II